MYTGNNIGAGGEKINPYRAEIDQYAKKTLNETGLFVGHKIDWWKLGSENDLGGRIWNYCKSCVIPEYANAVRDAFWDAMKADAKELSGSYKAQNGGLDSDAVKRIEKTLIEIMESADLTKVQKMELVLKTVGENKDVQGLVKSAASGLALSKYKLSSTPKSQTAFAQYQEALEYFKTEKNKAMEAIDKVTTLGSTANYATDQDMIDETGNVYRDEYREIKSLEELKEFQQAYAEARITVMVEVYDVPLGRGLLADLERNVINLLNENTDIVLSPEEKQDLIELVQIPRVMGAIDRLAQNTWKSETVQDAIARDIEGLRENFEGSLNDYLESVIEIMVKGCAGDAESLAKVEGNVREFLAYEADGVMGIEKNELLELVQIPRMSVEIKIINEGIATDDLMSKIQAKNNLKNLGTIYERYTNEKPISREKMNELNGDYLKETIAEMMDIIGNDKDAVGFLHRNVEKLLKDPKLNFSEKQKIEIRRELIVGSTDLNAKIDEMKGLLKEITQRTDISEGKKMELILTAIGDHPEFQAISPENGPAYFDSASQYFKGIKQKAIHHTQATLHGDIQYIQSSVFDSDRLQKTTWSDMFSKKHPEFHSAILENEKLREKLSDLTLGYNKSDIRSEVDLKKLRMEHAKAVIKMTIESLPFSDENVTILRKPTTNMEEFEQKRAIYIAEGRRAVVSLNETVSALTDSIEELAKDSEYPLSQPEVDELKSLLPKKKELNL